MTKINYKMDEFCGDLRPVKAHPDDAAFDLRSRIGTIIKTGEVKLIPTGLYMELPVGFEAQIRPRSGLALKHSIMIVNSPGTVDSGYRGEVGVIMMNAGKDNFIIQRGDRVAQMVINKLPEIEFSLVYDLSESTRGTGGFGSTGKN